MKPRMWTTLLVLLSLLIQLAPVAAQPVAAQASLPDKGQVMATMRKVDNAWQSTNLATRDLDWKPAVGFIGHLAQYDQIADYDDLLVAQDWAGKYGEPWQLQIRDKNNPNIGIRVCHSVDADSLAVGQPYLRLYETTPNDEKLKCLMESLNKSMEWAVVEISLGQSREINRIQIVPENNVPYRYYVDVKSWEGGNYDRTVVDRHANSQPAAFFEDTFTPVTVSHVRVVVVGATGYGGKDNDDSVLIKDVLLYEPSASTPISIPVQSDWPKCRGGEDVDKTTEATCANAIDGLPSTVWVTKVPRSAQVTSVHNSMNWWWVDATFMAMPVYAKVSALTDILSTGAPNQLQMSNRTAQVMNVRYHYARDERRRTDGKSAPGLYDKSYNLWYRDSGYINPAVVKKDATLKDPIFWSRGNGWAFAALARTLQTLPTDAPYYQEYMIDFKAMAEKIVAIQQPEGYWTANLLFRDQFTETRESSGTSLFTYGLAWGINNNYLKDPKYRTAVTKAWNWLSSEAVQPNGTVGFVQTVNPTEPARTTATTTSDYGVGVFLLAASEVLKLAPLPASPPTITVNSVNDPGNGLCDASECTLREAVAAVTPGGTINFNLPLPTTINLSKGELALGKAMTINGPGADKLVLASNGNNSRVLAVTGSNITVRGLTLKDGMIAMPGGGIDNSGHLTLKEVTVTNNWSIPSAVYGGWGGGIYNHGSGIVILDNSTVSGNRVSISGGGGIFNKEDGRVHLYNSKVTRNDGYYFAGGILNQDRGKIWMQIAPDGTWMPGWTEISYNDAYNVAGINNDGGEIRMVHTTVTANTGMLGISAIRSFGLLSIVESSVSGNGTGEGWGGGIIAGGTIEIIRSLINGNSAQRGSGGLIVGGNINILNSTISGNSAHNETGAIDNGGVMTITNSTIKDNVSYYEDRPGYAIKNSGNGIVKLVNTIVANKTRNCSGTFTSLGNNISSDDSCGFNAAGDLNNVDPKLNDLADNGGPTQTYALAVGSPAIDSGNNSLCPTTDQRGLPRPSDGNGDGSALCDRGSYEVQGAQGKANITILAEPTPLTPLNFRFYGPFGSFLLDNPETDDNDGVVQSISYSVVPGNYNFTENKPTGWFVMDIRCDRPELATVNLAQFSVNLAVKAGDQVQCRFVNAASATVETFSYWDKNRNRSFDSGDVGQSGWWSTLYDSAGKLRASNFTDATGKWTVVNLRPGSYTVCQNPRTGWYNIDPGTVNPAFGNRPCRTFTIGAGQTARPRFGYSDQPLLASDVMEDMTEVEVGERTLLEDQEGYYSNEEFLAAYGGELPSEEEAGGTLYLPLIEN